MPAETTIHPESSGHPQVRSLLAELDRYLAELYPPEANHILDEQALLDPAVRFFAACQGEQIVGCGALRLMPGEPGTVGRRHGEIKRMVVDPAARGRGIGEQLLRRLEQCLLDEGVSLALLETGRDQFAAVRLYERCGYQRRAAFGGYPDNGLSLFMARELA
jgi:putative acetyltransferase